MGDRGETENLNVDNSSPKQDGGTAITVDNVSSAPLVFLQESKLFGYNSKDYLKHEEMFRSVAHLIEPGHISGLQRVNGLWRIYVQNLHDKVVLMVHGVTLRGRHVNFLQTNPFVMDSEETTRIRIQNIPLSADDMIIKTVLVEKGLDVRSLYREKIRIDGRLTNCATGDRIAIVRTATLKEPLGRFLQFGYFKAKVIRRGQYNPNLKCGKCLDVGHGIATCKNEWKCAKCLNSGHRKNECTQSTQSDSESESRFASDTDDDVESSGEEKGYMTLIKETGAQSLPPSEPSQDNIKQLPHETPQSGNEKPKRKKKKAAKSRAQNSQNSGQSSIDNFFHNVETPAKGKSGSISRSPPTPAEVLNAQNTKTSCNNPDNGSKYYFM